MGTAEQRPSSKLLVMFVQERKACYKGLLVNTLHFFGLARSLFLPQGFRLKNIDSSFTST